MIPIDIIQVSAGCRRIPGSGSWIPGLTADTPYELELQLVREEFDPDGVDLGPNGTASLRRASVVINEVSFSTISGPPVVPFLTPSALGLLALAVASVSIGVMRRWIGSS